MGAVQMAATQSSNKVTQDGHAHSPCGRSSPLGATPTDSGVNFSVYSRDAQVVDLLFFDQMDDVRPSRVISLDPFLNRTYHYWHTFVPGVHRGQLYGYRVHGSAD